MTATVFAIAYWAILQTTYLDRLPPDHYAFLEKLKQPPYRGASFAVNAYAAPVAAATGGWAYLDPDLGTGEVRLTDSGFRVRRDFRYLWFADKTNPTYRRPDYFLCVSYQTIRSVVRPNDNTCSLVPLVALSRGGGNRYLSHRLVAVDESGRDRWAIVKLDWDHPPYLRPLDPRRPEARVRARPERGARGIGFAIDYHYAQQDGKHPAGALFTLYARPGPPRPCAEAMPLPAVRRSDDRRDLVLPADFKGVARIGVAPRTATKIGPEYLSPVLGLGYGAAPPDGCGAKAKEGLLSIQN